MKKKIKELADNIKTKKFPPPQNGPVFVKMWNALINQVTNHANFNPDFHLMNLETLCSLYQEERDLMKVLQEQGVSYVVKNARGEDSIRFRPEKTHMASVRGQIRSYCKALGLDLDRKAKNKGPVAQNDFDKTWG